MDPRGRQGFAPRCDWAVSANKPGPAMTTLYSALAKAIGPEP